MNIFDLKLCLLLFALAVTMHKCKEMRTLELPLYYIEPNRTANSNLIHSEFIIDEDEAARRGLTSYNKTMTNYLNYQYYTTLFVGANHKQMTFSLDNDIDDLWIPLNNCTG